jgi:hypothetical protein
MWQISLQEPHRFGLSGKIWRERVGHRFSGNPYRALESRAGGAPQVALAMEATPHWSCRQMLRLVAVLATANLLDRHSGAEATEVLLAAPLVAGAQLHSALQGVGAHLAGGPTGMAGCAGDWDASDVGSAVSRSLDSSSPPEFPWLSSEPCGRRPAAGVGVGSARKCFGCRSTALTTGVCDTGVKRRWVALLCRRQTSALCLDLRLSTRPSSNWNSGPVQVRQNGSFCCGGRIAAASHAVKPCSPLLGG